MPGEPLRESDVLGAAVEVHTCGMAYRMKRQPALEAGPLLPQGEDVSKLPRREPPPQAADEEQRVHSQTLALAFLPAAELVQLGPHEVGQHDLLYRGLIAAAFEHAERDPAPGPAVVVEDVAAVERQLMRPVNASPSVPL